MGAVGGQPHSPIVPAGAGREKAHQTSALEPSSALWLHCMYLRPQHQSFKTLLLLYRPSFGLKPKHKQGHIPDPKLTYDLGFSHRVAPRRCFRYVGTIQEEFWWRYKGLVRGQGQTCGGPGKSGQGEAYILSYCWSSPSRLVTAGQSRGNYAGPPEAILCLNLPADTQGASLLPWLCLHSNYGVPSSQDP